MGNFAASHSLPTFQERKAAAFKNFKYNYAANSKKWLTTDKIVDQIYCDIANGMTNSDIVQKLTNGLYEGQTRGIAKKTAQDYLTAAHDRMHYDFESKLPQMREDLYLKFMSVYEDCIAKGDRYNAIGALRGLMDVTGMNLKQPTTAIQINSDKEGGVTVNFGFKKEEETNED